MMEIKLCKIMQNNGVDEMLFVLLSFCIDIKAAPKTHVLIFVQVLQMGGCASPSPHRHTRLCHHTAVLFSQLVLVMDRWSTCFTMFGEIVLFLLVFHNFSVFASFAYF